MKFLKSLLGGPFALYSSSRPGVSNTAGMASVGISFDDPILEDKHNDLRDDNIPAQQSQQEEKERMELDAYFRFLSYDDARTAEYMEEANMHPTTSEASLNTVESPAAKVLDPLGSDMGAIQAIPEAYASEVLQKIADTCSYLHNVVQVEARYESVRDLCINRHTHCSWWSVLGECEKNFAYMKVNCAPACQSCEDLHIEARCPLDPNAHDAFANPGDLSAMFERIVTDPIYLQYEPVVISRPTYAPGDGPNNATYNIGMWMVMFENALSEEEADHMIELGGIEGYDRSAKVGTQNPDGTFTNYVNEGRTSYNAWCQGVCYQDPIAIRLMDRIANITGIPETNSEFLQLLRYEEGQYYQTHSDLIPYQAQRPCGVRILTYYMYLNDVEEGGGTYFHHLDKEVKPKKGRAVLWPSVFDHDPNLKDDRSEHEARHVIKGVKYGANAWIHQRDYKSAASMGCN